MCVVFIYWPGKAVGHAVVGGCRTEAKSSGFMDPCLSDVPSYIILLKRSIIQHEVLSAFILMLACSGNNKSGQAESIAAVPALDQQKTGGEAAKGLPDFIMTTQGVPLQTKAFAGVRTS